MAIFALDLLVVIVDTFVEVVIFTPGVLVFTEFCGVELCFKIVLALVLETLTGVAVKS
jgi:hypothetical protein